LRNFQGLGRKFFAPPINCGADGGHQVGHGVIPRRLIRIGALVWLDAKVSEPLMPLALVTGGHVVDEAKDAMRRTTRRVCLAPLRPVRREPDANPSGALDEVDSPSAALVFGPTPPSYLLLLRSPVPLCGTSSALSRLLSCFFKRPWGDISPALGCDLHHLQGECLAFARHAIDPPRVPLLAHGFALSAKLLRLFQRLWLRLSRAPRCGLR